MLSAAVRVVEFLQRHSILLTYFFNKQWNGLIPAHVTMDALNVTFL